MEKKELNFKERLAQAKARMDETGRRIEASNRKVEQLIEEGRRERVQFDRDMVDIARGKKPTESKPGIPDLQQKLAASRARIQRAEELDRSQQGILDELAANPLEEQCDAVYARMGQQLYALEAEEIEAASEAGAFLDEDERNKEADERLERSGQPPPIPKK